MAWRHAYAKEFAFCVPITTAMTTTELVAAPGAGHRLMVQALTICVTGTAAIAFDIEDSDGTVELFKAPISLAVGTYACDPGPFGVPLTTNTALRIFIADPGLQLTVSGFGWVQEL